MGGRGGATDQQVAMVDMLLHGDGCGEHHLHVAAAAPGAAHRHRRLAAGQDAERAVAGGGALGDQLEARERVGFHEAGVDERVHLGARRLAHHAAEQEVAEPGEVGADEARLAAQLRREDVRVVAELLGGHGGPRQRHRVAAEDHVLDVVERRRRGRRPGRLHRVQHRPDGRGHPVPEPVEQVAALRGGGGRGRVRHRGAARDQVQRAADYVGQDEGHHLVMERPSLCQLVSSTSG